MMNHGDWREDFAHGNANRALFVRSLGDVREKNAVGKCIADLLANSAPKAEEIIVVMRTKIQALLAAALIPLFPLAAAPAETPKDVVQALYTAHFKDFDSFGPGLHKKEHWLSKGFLGAIHAYQQSLASHPSKSDVDGFDGDLFTDAQDEPARFSVGEATVNGDHAKVPFTLVLADKKKVYETRKCTAKLVNEKGAWKVDDLVIEKDDMRTLLANFSRAK